MPSYICKTSGCGNDLTATVIRLQLSGEGYEVRHAAQPRRDPVVVTCPKCKAMHEYP
jgi:RNase P subunit RPR2